MLHISKLRSPSQNGFIYAARRFVGLLVLTLVLPMAASAYTVILRNGRSVTIPDSFSLTRAGITYEYAPGLYVTIQMTSIDIAATERANGEPAGSLEERAEKANGKGDSTSPVNSQQPATRRTLTDKDLEAARQRRLESESLYEQRRKKLGLPSIEDTRKEREAETRRMVEMEAMAQAGNEQSEAYWRARASELREALAVNESEINYLRSKLNEISSYSSTVTFTSVLPLAIGQPVRDRFPSGGFPYLPPGASVPPARVPMRAPLYLPPGGTTPRPLLPNPIRPYTDGTRGPWRGGSIFVLPLPFYAPYYYNYSYDQSMMLARLHELEAERAGLQARWRLLEEEARRAGALPGWLRP